MDSREIRDRAKEVTHICRLLVDRAKEMNKIADMLEEKEKDKDSRFEEFINLYKSSKEELTEYEKGFLDGLNNARDFFNAPWYNIGEVEVENE